MLHSKGSSLNGHFPLPEQLRCAECFVIRQKQVAIFQANGLTVGGQSNLNESLLQ